MFSPVAECGIGRKSIPLRIALEDGGGGYSCQVSTCRSGHVAQVGFFFRDELRQLYPRCRGSAFSILAGGRRPCLIECLHVVEIKPKYSPDLLLLPAGSEWDEPLRLYPQTELLLDLSQTVQRLLPCRKMPRGGDVEVARPGIFRSGAPLEEQVGPSGVGTADPTVKTTVPQTQPVRLALRNDLPRRQP